MRRLLQALRKLVGVAIVLALLTVAYLTGTNVYDFFFVGTWTPLAQAEAQMAGLRDLDLARDANGIVPLTAALGVEPEYQQHAADATNVEEYRWFGGAVRVRAADGTPIRIEIGDSRSLEPLPWNRPKFPGAFLGLRLGDPAPSAAAAAAVRERARRCCDADHVDWRTSGGRIVGIDFVRRVVRIPGR
jgi:hypothetical protein